MIKQQSLKKKFQFSYRLLANSALFTDPATKLSGDKFTYSVPTYEALLGITKNIYYNPEIVYIIDEVRIINEIIMDSQGILYNGYRKKISDLSSYTYLLNVEYEVIAHIEKNPMNTENVDINKYYSIFMKNLKLGGKHPIYLGTSECTGYVIPVKYGVKPGFYDLKSFNFGLMHHSFTYPNQNERNEYINNIDNYRMKSGIINFHRPEDTKIHRLLERRPY